MRLDIHLLSVEKTPPALNAPVDIVFPFLITELKEEITDAVLVRLTHEVINESLKSKG